MTKHGESGRSGWMRREGVEEGGRRGQERVSERYTSQETLNLNWSLNL